jgi:outer membrane protein TolC
MVDDRLSELDRRSLNAQAMLARWIGDAASTPFTGQPSIETVPLRAHALEADLADHPMIAMLRQQVALCAKPRSSWPKQVNKPIWSVEVSYGARGPAYSNLLSVGVSVPLQWDQKNRQDREVSAKIAMAEQAKALEADALRSHVAEVRTMLNEWDSGRERLKRYQGELLPLAKSRTEASLAAYRGGKGELSAVLAARGNEIDVRLQTLQLEMDTARAWSQLAFLVPDHDAHAASVPALSAVGPNRGEAK